MGKILIIAKDYQDVRMSWIVCGYLIVKFVINVLIVINAITVFIFRIVKIAGIALIVSIVWPVPIVLVVRDLDINNITFLTSPIPKLNIYRR